MPHNLGGHVLGRFTNRYCNCQLCDIGNDVDGYIQCIGRGYSTLIYELTRSYNNNTLNNNAVSRLGCY